MARTEPADDQQAVGWSSDAGGPGTYELEEIGTPRLRDVLGGVIVRPTVVAAA